MWLPLTSLAFGQALQPGDFIPYAPVLLDTNDVSWSTGGVGSPAVVHDEFLFFFNTVILVYETQTGPATTSCPAGEWSIGAAFSTDGGQSFTDFGQPIVEPTPGTYYSCVAAHPTVVDYADGNLVLFFKTEQAVDVCDTGPAPSWGCDRYTGLGRVTAQAQLVSIIPLSYTYNISNPDPAPVLTGVLGGNADLGFPKAVFDNGEYRLTMQQRPDIYHVHGATSSSLTLDPTPILTTGYAPYASDEVYNAAVACDQYGDIQALVGGRDRANGQLADQGMDNFTTSDWSTWTYVNGPYYQLTQGAPDMRHFDLLRYSTNEFALYWSEPLGPGGTNRIRAAHTSVANISPNDRVCP